MEKIDKIIEKVEQENNYYVKKWDYFWDLWRELKSLPYKSKERRERKLRLMQEFLSRNEFDEKGKYGEFFLGIKNATLNEEGKVILGESNKNE